VINMPRVLALASVVLGLIGAVAGTRNSRITPELEPVSDKKFFKKDYPADTRPKVTNHFGYPYPTVQDSDRFDKDYVEDKNDDGGYWKAQTAYDESTNKLRKEKSELKKALTEEQAEERDLEKVIAEEKELEKAAEAAEAKMKAAQKENAEAADKVKEAENGIDGGSGGSGGQVAVVEKEVADLEDCKKQLTDARSKLKALLAEKAEREAKAAEAAKTEKSAEVKEVKAEKVEEDLEQNVKDAEKKHEEALKDYKGEMADVEKAEESLDDAAKNLRKYRTADPGGGVSTKNGASSLMGLPAQPFLAAALLLAMQ